MGTEIVNLDDLGAGPFAILGDSLNGVVPRARERLNNINATRMTAHYFTDEAPKLAKTATFDFNGVTISVSRDVTDEEVLAAYDAELASRHKAYQESPKGIADAKAAAEWLSRDQGIIDAAVASAATLDFKDARAVLTWVREWHNAADHIGVNWPREDWAAALSAAGWVGGECCGAAFVKGDAASEARWLLGQILSNMNSGMPPHPVCGKFIDDYLSTFK
tara:strand:- start:1510 stop:2169 length:660 start_codon:yes stop_codon:yes gene_type:complete